MRLGFVGVGKHAQKMAAAFRECGAEIVAFDRYGLSLDDLPGFGKPMSWREMVTSPDIDAIVVCAPPGVTAEVASVCLDAAKPCCATKPLIWDRFPEHVCDSPTDIARGIHVDLWRLSSPAWLALKADLQGREIRSVHVDFYGNGPMRSTHDGFDDYAPWALAFLLDLGIRPELTWSASPGFSRWKASGAAPEIQLQTGSGFTHPRMRVRVNDSLEWLETDSTQGYFRADQPMVQCHRDVALRAFVRAFMAGEPSDTLRISCEASRLMIDGRRQCSLGFPAAPDSEHQG